MAQCERTQTQLFAPLRNRAPSNCYPGFGPPHRETCGIVLLIKPGRSISAPRLAFDIRYAGRNPGVAALLHLFLLFTLFLAAAFAASASFTRFLSLGFR